MPGLPSVKPRARAAWGRRAPRVNIAAVFNTHTAEREDPPEAMTKNARTHAALALLLLLAALCPAAPAQGPGERFDFYARGPYRQQVPRPQTLLRYDVGEFHTNYAMMERVVAAIAAAAPDRVRVFDIGLTNEHRMQHVVAVSAPENIARLDEIRSNLKRLADPRTLPDAEARRLASATPVALWMQYTIHG